MPHDAYFQGNPTRLDVSRSKFHAAPRWSGSWNVGRLVPIFATSSIMPGDTFKMSIASAIRMTRPYVPVMDDMDITIEAFFVPHRLILSRKSMSPDINDSNHSWAAFIGAQDSLLNMPTPGDVRLPDFAIGGGTNYLEGGLADCLGMHLCMDSNNMYLVNCLKPLAYYAVWNDYFREPNTQNPVTFALTTRSAPGIGSYVSLSGGDAGIPVGYNYLSKIPLAPVSRYHGYFGSALPWPQRNSTQVQMPLGALAPLIASDSGTVHEFGDVPKFSTTQLWKGLSGTSSSPITNGVQWVGGFDQGDSGGNYTPELRRFDGLTKNNLFADLSTATAASVNQFRLAVQTQRWYEALARSGNKYADLVNGMFGVRGPSIPDRPEYLGGFTAPINISQVNGTSGTDLGATGAFSLSNPSGYLFTKSFTEHGTLIVVACCRVRESFSQGYKREDRRFDRFDFYWPQFANIGETYLEKGQLYADGTSSDDEVFGYQEAWAEYRMFQDDVTGAISPTANLSIGNYTYANFFNGHPTLKSYLDASSQVSNVDRTLTVSSSTAGFQLFGQFQFDIDMVRPMPTYSIPGLVDHH